MDKRHDYSGSRHHVMARGGSRRNIYDGTVARRGFLALLKELEPRFGVQIHAYALMGNHFHLLLSSHQGKLSAAMHFLNGTHARRYNKRVGQDGPLYRRRYESRLVEDERYWLHLLAYVHLNPLKDRFVADSSVLPWTSHLAYLGLQSAPFLHLDEHLELLGGRAGYLALIEGVESGYIERPTNFEQAIARFPEAIPGRRPSPPPVVDVLDALDACPIPPDLVLGQARRGLVGNRAWLTWWLDRTGNITRSALAEILGVSKSTITRRIRLVDSGELGPMPVWLGEPSERLLESA